MKYIPTQKIVFILFLLLISSPIALFAQEEPNAAFKYQAVARDGNGNILGNQNITVKIAILADGSTLFEETHATSTSDLGIFTLEVGSQGGDLSGITWSSGNHLLRVSIDVAGGNNFVDVVPDSKILGVPYALHAQTADAVAGDDDPDPTNELQELIVDGDQISLSGDTSETVIDLGDLVEEIVGLQDTVIINNIQEISLDGNTLTLSQGGGSVELPSSGMGDADSNPENEIQVLSRSDNEITLSPAGGSVSINDDDADPSNEIQSLSLENNMLQISDGNTVDLGSISDADADPTNEIQTLSKSNNGQFIILSNDGGQVVDEVEDADANPENEIQQLGLSGNTLTLSPAGGSVELPIPGASPWTEADGEVNYDLDARVGRDATIVGQLSAAENKVQMFQDGGDAGNLETYAADGTVNIRLSRFSGNDKIGALAIFNSGQSRIWLGSTNNSPWGNVQTSGPNGNLNVSLTAASGNANCGEVRVHDASGAAANQLTVTKIFKNQSDAEPLTVGALINDVKLCRIDHPERENMDIWYTAMEGPEAGTYTRGQIVLANGKAHIEFPEDFQIMANPEGMTISLTPHSAESKGLAAIERTSTGFTIKELFNGTGNYLVDWEVKTVRKGFENIPPIRAKK